MFIAKKKPYIWVQLKAKQMRSTAEVLVKGGLSIIGGIKMADYLGKIIALEHILQSSPNGVTMPQILDRLDNEYGITADRKSIYNNINVLTRFMPIYTEKRQNKFFYCLQRSDNE
jgi:hypothetical protein